MIRIRFMVVIMFTLIGITGKLFAQETQFSGWGAVFHTQRFSKHLGISFDAQFRSADQFAFLRNVLLRPSANYYWGKNKMAALGYAYIATNGRDALGEPTFRPESRIWEQFILNQKIGKSITLQHRFRLEQRFLGNTTLRNDHFFSQRLRYFARSVIPFGKDSVFTQGPFIAIQNEFFINLQNKDKVNGHLFDQNRAYVALGYRLSKKIDAEAGYLNQYINNRNTHTINNILQIAFYTRF